MRIYEFARNHEIPTKEVLHFLQQHNVDVHSHMAVIPDDAMELLAKKFVKSTQAAEVAPEPKPNIPPPAPVTPAPQKMVPEKPAAPSPTSEVIPLEPMTIAQFATLAKKPVSDVILTLLRQGMVAVKNQVVNEKVVAQLTRFYGLKIAEQAQQARRETRPVAELKGHQVQERLPIVVVIGHVDHGKTTLLDFIRKTRVAAKEKGGITQHLGAYEAHTKQGNLVFLDTPGHEAFTKMRERGTKLADIAVLVVAADDGVMPQTIEAVKQAQAAKIPLIVAINKIDKVGPQQIENVKRALTQYGLVSEEWGGQTIFVPISAKFGTGVDDLLDILVLQSKLLELVAMLDVPAQGYILEAKQEKGRGPVATIIVQNGILRVGDNFIAGGRISGKVSSLIDSWGKRVIEAYPSQPIQVAGFDTLPQAGDTFEVVSASMVKKQRQVGVSKLPSVRSTAQEQGLNLVIKVDNDSSREVVLDAVHKINEKAFKKLHVLYCAIGQVSESDVQLASDTQANIYTLHTRADAAAIALSMKLSVAIKQFDIIYKLLENLEAATQEGRPIKKITKKTGEAVVLKVFDIKGLGVIAGAQVRTGKLVKDGKVIVWRGKHKVGEGVIKSLQREKKSIKEATSGMECAFMVDDFNAWLPDDRVECFQEVPAET